MIPDEEKTTITISKSVKEKLASFGKKDETYDELLSRILDELKVKK